MAPVDASDTLLEPGFVLGSCELLGMIARGGMANVWLARMRMKHGLETLVSIKTILPELSMEPEFQQMFLEEARIACGIDHPNVARVLDVGEQHDRSYIVMEYVAGESLAHIRRAFARRGQPFPLRTALRIVADLSSGLHAAHELCGRDGQRLNVVHRDVSPQNVLVSDAGCVKLIDFGVAKARGRLGADTSVGNVKGKIRYMAPEQAIGHDVDRRSDVWAVGAVLYEILSGQTPVDGPDDVTIFRNILAGAPMPPLSEHVPEPVRALLARALCRSPEDRFQTAADLRDATEDVMHAVGLRASSKELEALSLTELPERAAQRRRFVQLALSRADDRGRCKAAHDGVAVRPGDRHGPTDEEPATLTQPLRELTIAPVEGATVAREAPSSRSRLRGALAGMALALAGTWILASASPPVSAAGTSSGSSPSSGPAPAAPTAPPESSAWTGPTVEIAELPAASADPVRAAPSAVPVSPRKMPSHAAPAAAVATTTTKKSDDSRWGSIE